MPHRFWQKLLFCFSIALFAATGVFAQTENCAIRIEVTRNDTDAAINGATAIAVNSVTKKSYKSALRGGMPYFRNLPAGEYRVTVTKAGFMRSADDFVVSCVLNEEIFGIALFRGNPSKIFRLYERVQLKAPPVGLSGSTTPSPTNENAGAGIAAGQDDEDIPPPLPRPRPKTTRVVPKVISGGVLNGKATNLVKPQYPKAALAVRAAGVVNVQITIDEEGNVISASAVSGHPLLRAAAVKAARALKFTRTTLSGQPVKVTGVIVYNFSPPESEKETQ